MTSGDMAIYTSILLLCLGLLQLLTAQERQAVWERHQERQAVFDRHLDRQDEEREQERQESQYGNHSRWEVSCASSCSVEVRRQLYSSLGCTMLKDYSSHSQVACPGSVDLQGQQSLVFHQLPPHSDSEAGRERPRREVRSQPKPLDMRDSMEEAVYHRFPAILHYLEDLATRHSEFVELLQLGESHEGRPIVGVRLGRGKADKHTPSVLVDGGMHAREWVTVATAIGVLGHLVRLFLGGDCAEVPLTNLHWYIVPVLNPDGYEFSHTGDRLWRKNRSPAPQGTSCMGVDLNRNFGIGYGLGADSDPCSEVFKGSGPASEPETRALVSLATRLNSSLLYYVSLHAYGQSWLTPWGYKLHPAPNSRELHEVAREAFKQMECSFGRAVPAREYDVGAAADIYYTAGGSSDDWLYSQTSTRFSYTIELPDDGRKHGFLLPAARVPEVVEDMWVALRSLALQALVRTL